MFFSLLNIKLKLINLIYREKTFLEILLNKEKKKLVEFFTYFLIIIGLNVLILFAMLVALRLILVAFVLMLILLNIFEL